MTTTRPKRKCARNARSEEDERPVGARDARFVLAVGRCCTCTGSLLPLLCADALLLLLLLKLLRSQPLCAHSRPCHAPHRRATSPLLAHAAALAAISWRVRANTKFGCVFA